MNGTDLLASPADSAGRGEDELPEIEPALGTVVEGGRQDLSFALIHGESAIACATWALAESGVTCVDARADWEGIVAAEEAYVLHDVACPMADPATLAGCVALAQRTGAVVVGVRPVTDTIKTVDQAAVTGTVDRAGLVEVASPVVLPATVVAGMDAHPGEDLPALVERLRTRLPVQFVEVPASARRVESAEDLRVLEAMTAPRR